MILFRISAFEDMWLPIGRQWPILRCLILWMMACSCGCTSTNTEQNPKKIEPTITDTAPKEFKNSIGMKMVYIPAGTFTMGSPPSEHAEPVFKILEKQRTVKINKPFYLAATETTFHQYQLFSLGRYPEEVRKDPELLRSFWAKSMPQNIYPDHPVVLFSWEQAVEFCKWLSEKEGKIYRLPTEEEWQYACRAGTTLKFGCTDNEDLLEQYAWFSSNSEDHPHKVATKKPNQWGLYDMNGNVWEWVSTTVPASLIKDSSYMGKKCAFIRGGGFSNSWNPLRCASRWGWFPVEHKSSAVGFRVVCEVTTAKFPTK